MPYEPDSECSHVTDQDCGRSTHGPEQGAKTSTGLGAFPAGGGEMGARIRAYDWSQTPLGPIDTWSQSLCTNVVTLLASPFPAVLVWGEAFTVCAYNDAYRPLLGEKPEALGQPFLEVWAEAGEVIAPLLIRAYAGEACCYKEAELTLLRNGHPEQVYFDYAFSPVGQETGSVRGVLNIAVETTERVQSRAELRASEQRYEAVFDASPFALALTKVPERVTVDVNDAFLDFFEFERSEVVGKTSVDLGISNPNSQAQVAAELQAQGRVRDLQVTRVTKSGARRHLSLNIDRVSIRGEGYVLTTIQDVTSLLMTQRQLEDANAALEEQAVELEEQAAELATHNEQLHLLAESLAAEQAWLHALLDTLPVGVVLSDPKGEFTLINPAAHAVTGSRVTGTAEEPAGGYTLHRTDGSPFPANELPLARVLKEGTEVRNVEVVFRHDDGAERVALTAARPVYMPNGELVGAVALLQDITERKQAEQRQAFRLALGERLRNLREPTAIMDAAAEMLGQHLDTNRVGYAELDEIGKTLTIREWTDGTVDSMTGHHPVLAWGAEAVTAQRRGEIWRTDDATADPRPGVHRHLDSYWAVGVSATVAVPLIRQGRWRATLYMISAEPRVWTDEEVALIQDAGEHTWEAVERGRAEQALRRDAAELESLNQANETLLREINHRVKNNLTAILGLLYVEERRLREKPQPRCSRILDDLKSRVQSLATTHALLSAGKWQPLRLDELAGEVVQATTSLIAGSRAFSMEVAASPVRVTPTQAHHLALVLSELTMNTIKHAADMRIQVRAELVDGEARLIYRDRGRGYPQAVLEGAGRSVGLDIVNSIVGLSLRGSWSLRNEDGAVTEVRFPVDLTLNAGPARGHRGRRIRG